ncbi:MAG: CheB methylesterase domain-containing protein [Cellulosilyticum sp.]|nr:CheB methylesterase domain-containing protein [Cellulosilyticum sp.]
MKQNSVNDVYSEIDRQYEYIVAMGISTGGPKLLSQVIKSLDEELSATYIIVQHMPVGFTKNLAERLNSLTKLTVKEAEDGDYLKRGVVYIAPGGYQLKIINGLKPQVQLTDELPYKGHKPSVNMMLLSLSNIRNCTKKMVSVIMTGMGCDGLEGVTELKKTHSCKVIAQDQPSSTVFGMPKAIINAGLADYIVSGENISQKIKEIVGDSHGR